MTTFFTADTHFGHASIIDHCARPFASAAEMDRAMVDIWNSVVGPRDTVWHVGDFWCGPSRDKADAERVFRRLHGQKHLVAGNHDGAATKALPWASVRDGVAVVNRRRGDRGGVPLPDAVVAARGARGRPRVRPRPRALGRHPEELRRRGGQVGLRAGERGGRVGPDGGGAAVAGLCRGGLKARP